jgi:DNA excision repair protein ERCC-2
MADERNTNVGQEVGYQVRLDRQIGDDTRIAVVTEGIMVRILQSDPFLERIGAVILDEFHERNLNSDLSLALLKKVREEVRPDLSIVVMSATLEPLDVFREVTGLDRLADAGRPVVERTYGLSFPESNRASFAVDAPAFTHENRGPAGADTETRRLHADAAASVAAVPGNVLVGMPNYAEAAWMAGVLEERLDKPVLLDESSADRVTEALKAEFFDGPGKVLVTSLRGTLTEGVDYRGDRLGAAVVCGVPIIDTSSPRTRAVVEAYDRTFGDGFETALVVPAVRKARQALGRVIRGPDERGVRVLVDERYARDVWNGVRDHLPPHERREFTPTTPDMLDLGLERFRSGE